MEIHLSDVDSREEWRHLSVLADVVVARVKGEGVDGYRTALAQPQGGAVSRADRVAARLAEREADLLLVTDLVNIRYLTGFTGSSAMAVVGPETRRFITDFRYVERAKAEVERFDRERAPQEFAEALKTGWPEGTVRLGFEDQHLSVRQHKRLRELLPDRIELVAAGGAVEAERALKEPGEVEAIRAAAALADDIYAGCASAAWSAAPSARWRSRSRRRCAAAARAARASPRSWPRPSTARCRTPSRATSRSPPARSSPSTSG